MSDFAATAPSAFEAKYRAQPDPWNFARSGYERARYRMLLNALQATRYTSAFEPGCSVGVLSKQLARRCDRLLATDVSESALREARQRCAANPNVRFERVQLGALVPEGPFDLIVFSEVGYYFTAVDLARLVRSLVRRCASGAEFLAVHWLGHSQDHLLHGDEVHKIIRREFAATPLTSARTPHFRLDNWRVAW